MSTQVLIIVISYLTLSTLATIVMFLAARKYRRKYWNIRAQMQDEGRTACRLARENLEYRRTLHRTVSRG